MAIHKSVRALTRGLDLLTAIGRHGGNVQVLARALGLNRTTVYRQLQTLEEAGYLSRSPSDEGYRLTLKVRELSEGYGDSAWISEVGAPVLGELFREVAWPSDLATFDRDAMLVRESTHRFSPFSIHRGMIGRRIPMLSAIGKAYLAFSTEHTRQNVLDVLALSPDPANAWARDRAGIAAMLDQVRQLGHATSIGEPDPTISGLAMPVRHDGMVLACVNIVVLRSAMTMPDIVQRYLPALQRAAQRMEQELAAHDIHDLRGSSA